MLCRCPHLFEFLNGLLSPPLRRRLHRWCPSLCPRRGRKHQPFHHPHLYRYCRTCYISTLNVISRPNPAHFPLDLWNKSDSILGGRTISHSPHIFVHKSVARSPAKRSPLRPTVARSPAKRTPPLPNYKLRVNRIRTPSKKLLEARNT